MRQQQRGLTLIELIVAVTVLRMIAGIGWPALQGAVNDVERRSSLNNVYHTLALGRTEAIKSGSIVTICPLNDSDICTGDWTRPVSIFRDPDNLRELTTKDDLIHTMQPPDAGTLRVRVGNRGYFQYAPSGRVRGTLGNISYCPPDNQVTEAGQIIINMGGRPRRARDHDGDGIVEVSDGSALSCP